MSSTEADQTINAYATAIGDFLHGLNDCRGVIASRFFHGPRQFGWPRFRVLPLTSKRRFELIKKANLKLDLEQELVAQLETTGQQIRSMAGNPMFLGLLCEHMLSGHKFPDSSHTMFETYVNSRLTRDKERLHKRFGLAPSELRMTAEAAAFCMSADPGLGLSPKRQEIKSAAQKLEIKLDRRFDKILDAITFLKLARADTSTATDKSEQFTFAHRRFQEYFSTAVVLRETTRVSPTQLLLDARWRECAVVMCQTQPPEKLTLLINEAESLVGGFAEAVKIYEKEFITAPAQECEVLDTKTSSPRIQWPTSALHVMGLLQEGFARRLDVLPATLRNNLGRVLTIISGAGITIDKKWALDVSGCAPALVLTDLLRKAFNDPSQVLRDSAYQQVARLNEIPADIAYSIRGALCHMALTGRLRRQTTTTRAYLSRLDRSSSFLRVLRLLSWLPIVDFGLHVALLTTLLIRTISQLSLSAPERTWVVGAQFTLALFIGVSYFGWYSNVFLSAKNLLNSLIIQRDEKDTKNSTADQFALLVNNRVSIICLAGIMIMVWDIQPRTFQILFSDQTVPRIPHTDSGLLSLIPIWMYISIWASLAIIFSLEGRFMNPLLWLIFPVLAIGKMIKGMITVFISLFTEWKETVKGLIGMVALFGLIGLLVYTMVLFPYVGISVGLAVSVGVLIFMVFAVVIRVKDLLLWLYEDRQSTGVTTTEFIYRVRLYRSEKYRVRYISTIRAKGLLLIADDTEELIYSLARELESLPSSDSSKSFFLSRYLSKLPFVSKLNEKIQPSPKRSSTSQTSTKYKYGVAVLDEILRLLEQVRSAA